MCQSSRASVALIGAPRAVRAQRADKYGLTPAALAVVRSRVFVASTIIGVTAVAQLEGLARYFELAPACELLADIDEIHATWPSPAGQ